MISLDSVNEVLGLAETITNKGVALTTVINSPVHELISSMDGVPVALENIDKVMYAQAANGTHQAVMSKYVALAAASMATTTSTIKNDVLPRVHSIVASMRSLQGTLDQDVIPYKVRLVHPAPLLLLPEVKTLTSRFLAMDPQEDPVKAIPMIASRSMTIDDLVELVKYTDSNDFNAILERELLDGKGEIVLEILEGRGWLPNNSSDVTVLVATLLAVNAIEEPMEGVLATLADFSRVRRWSTWYCATQIERRRGIEQSATDANRLYNLDSSIKREANTIYLNANVFTKLIEEHDVIIEMILGNEILGREYPSSALTRPEVRGELLAVYNKEVGRLTKVLNDKRTTESRRLVYKSIMDHVKAAAEDEATLAQLDDTVESLTTRAHKVCQNLDQVSFTGGNMDENIVAVAICYIFHAHTDVPLMLATMEMVAKNNPEYTTEEIRVAAIIDRIASYVVNQVCCIK